MTRIDFYISPSQDTQAGLQLVCRIAEKAWQKQQRVYVCANDPEQGQQLDDLLWVFRAGSFIPHCQSQDENCAQAAVVIGTDNPPDMPTDVLINLKRDVPGFFSRFERVIEIVAGPEVQRNLARERFKFYRDRGYPLETHELSS